MASTNGTSATTAAQSSGRIVVTAPISRPPADTPRAAMRPSWATPAFEQVLGRGDEVREGVDLVAHPAALVP